MEVAEVVEVAVIDGVPRRLGFETLVLPSFGFLVLPSFGFLVLPSFGFLVLPSFGFLVLPSFGFLVLPDPDLCSVLPLVRIWIATNIRN
jgi:hypothetical protein